MTNNNYNNGFSFVENSTTSKSIVLEISSDSLKDSTSNSQNSFDFVNKWNAYKICLREGISAPFEAKVSVILTEKIKPSELKLLLEKPVSIYLGRESNLDYLHVKSRALTGIFSSYVFDSIYSAAVCKNSNLCKAFSSKNGVKHSSDVISFNICNSFLRIA